VKNKSSLLISLFLLTSSILSLHGQVDSLRIELNKNPNSTDALIAITEIYLLTNLDSADYYVSRLKELTPSENQRVNTSMTIAEYYYQIYELDSALVYAKYVYDISENTSDNNLKLKALNKLIVLSELMGDFDTTQKHINTSIEIIPLADDFSAIVRIYTTIGTFFVYQNQYEKGLKYYLRVDSLYSQGVTPDRGLAIVYENIGSNYNSNLDPLAIQYYDKANEIYQNIGDEEGYNNSLMLKGEFYIRTKEYEKGLDNLEMSLDFFEGYGQAESLSLLYDALLLGYVKTNQSQKAQSIHEKRKTLIQSLDAPYILQPFHQISGEYFFSKGEYSQALNHFQESYDISTMKNTKP